MPRRLTRCTLITLLLISAAHAAAAAEERSDLMKGGDQLLATGRYEDALKIYTRLDREAGGGSAAALVGVTRAQFGIGRYGEAAAAARRVVALGAPAQAVAQAFNLLGLSLYRHWLLGLDDISPEAVARLARQRKRAGLPPAPSVEVLKESAQAFRRAVELGPEYDLVRYNLAATLFELGEIGEARQEIAAYVSRGGDHPDALALHACLQHRGLGEVGREIQRVGGAVSRPEKIAGSAPAYTWLARALQLEATVVLDAIIDEEGRVLCLRPLERAQLGLTEAAIQAVRSWKFQPAQFEGRPVVVYYTLTVTFRVQ